MFDFKRQIGDYVARNGRSEMIDITSSVNRLMLDEIEEYANKHVKIDFRTGAQNLRVLSLDLADICSLAIRRWVDSGRTQTRRSKFHQQIFQAK